MTGEGDTPDGLRAENARLVALLVLHGIEWRKPAEVDVQPAAAALSTDQKVALFRRLFRGRTDVYPVRWESKAGKTGSRDIGALPSGRNTRAMRCSRSETVIDKAPESGHEWGRAAYAAAGCDRSKSRRCGGYQRLKCCTSTSLRTAQRTCSSASVPSRLQRMWPFFFIRWPIAESTADSAPLVEIGRSAWYRLL